MAEEGKILNDTLKRLLDAEKRAQLLVDAALEQQQQTLERARREAREAENRFNERMRDLRQSLDARAEESARRSIAELERRFDERRQQLQALADKYREEACEAAVAIVIDPERT